MTDVNGNQLTYEQVAREMERARAWKANNDRCFACGLLNPDGVKHEHCKEGV